MHTSSLKKLSEGLRTRQFSSRELTQHFLARIDTLDPQINSFITVTAERALAQARRDFAGLLALQGQDGWGWTESSEATADMTALALLATVQAKGAGGMVDIHLAEEPAGCGARKAASRSAASAISRRRS